MNQAIISQYKWIRCAAGLFLVLVLILSIISPAWGKAPVIISTAGTTNTLPIGKIENQTDAFWKLVFSQQYDQAIKPTLTSVSFRQEVKTADLKEFGDAIIANGGGKIIRRSVYRTPDGIVESLTILKLKSGAEIYLFLSFNNGLINDMIARYGQ